MEKIYKEQNFVSAVVYVHNNEREIHDFIIQLHKVLTENFLKFEVIIVNDASIDNSMACIKECTENLPKQMISILNMSYHHGLEASMNAGVDLAIGDFVFEFDNVYADYTWETLMGLYFASLNGYDIVSETSNKI